MLQVHDGLAVYSFGEGEPVFLMPGPHRYQRPGLRSADALIEGLVALGMRVITFDPPGSGRSTRPARLSMDEMHRCTDETLSATGVDGPVDALGHSMAGLALLAYAIERPAAIRRLVLVGTGSGGPALMGAPGAIHGPGHRDFWKMAVLGSLQMLWPFRAPEYLVLNMIERASLVDGRHFSPRPIVWRDWLQPREGRPDWTFVARRLDYAPRLGEIRAATLVLAGRHDPQYPSSCSEELHAGIPGSRLVSFERSGHYPFIEEADAFWATVGRFLAMAPDEASMAGGRTADQSSR